MQKLGLFLITILYLINTNSAWAQSTSDNIFTHQLNFESSHSNTTYTWQTSPWGACSGFCASAMQYRSVQCLANGIDPTDITLCDSATMPDNSRSCTGSCCAPQPTCSPGMTLFDTGTDSNGCNTGVCVFETCALQPNCASRTDPATYNGLDGGGCPSWTCPPATCSENPPGLRSGRCPNGSRPGWYGDRASNGCAQLRCLNVQRQCQEGPTRCPSGNGYSLQISGTNPATGCRIRSCLPTASYGSGNTAPTPTPSCPSRPSCRSGETLVTRGTNAQGCTIYRCEGQTCPRPPSCPPGQTRVSTGSDNNGCGTYLCQP